MKQIVPHRRSAWGTKVEQLRQQLTQDKHTHLEFEDLGAGSANQGPQPLRRSLADLARNAARRQREGELLYRICQHYQPRRCLEFGTNLGISALYQLGGLRESRFITMEGAPSIASVARQHFQDFGQDQVEILVGEFSALFEERLSLEALQPDYVFVDGNHRYQATVDYFQRLLPHMTEGGIMIFDDINWSAEMQRAWREIIAEPEVSLSFDGFMMGVCFVKMDHPKEHHRLSYWPF
ncbi:MAG: class I SAM-dependent methyltransferase [Bacteroidota bacterium]